MNENIVKRNELLAAKTIKGLESRNMSGYYAADKEGKFDILAEVRFELEWMLKMQQKVLNKKEIVMQDEQQYEQLLLQYQHLKNGAEDIAKLIESKVDTVSRLAYGLQMGGNLDYTDALTLSKAVEGRRKL